MLDGTTGVVVVPVAVEDGVKAVAAAAAAAASSLKL